MRVCTMVGRQAGNTYGPHGGPAAHPSGIVLLLAAPHGSGRAAGWGWGSAVAGALCNRKLPAGDPSRAALVADLIIQTILFCFSK